MKIFCIGRNYIDHAKELNNPIPKQPLVFMKPPTALLKNKTDLFLPDFTNDLHYEIELVLKISKNGKHIKPDFANNYFEEIGIGIDFTARDIQNQCKEKGHPWEIAKGFDNSALVSSFVHINEVKKGGINFSLRKNNIEVQKGNSNDLIFSFENLICYLSKYFTLQKGDFIFTGTPAGVGAIKIGDKLEGFLENRLMFNCNIK